jgi:vitamin B12/bleomycin/antimicrobial peptide transport system ATP-binding/permease protein
MKNGFLRSFWYLCRGYWKSEEKWRANGLLGIVVSLNFVTVYLLVQINNWYSEFYNALQEYQSGLFWPLVGKFSLLAFLYIAIAVYAIYLRQMLQIKWRIWMTDRYLKNWMDGQVYYRLQVLGQDMDNPDQRIQEDINQFVTLTLQLFLGLLKQLTTLVAFAVVLWNLSGVIDVPIGSTSFRIYGYMVWFSLVYSVIGTYLAHRVGRQLIALDYDQQRYEADFRFNMVRVRENSESIAFYGGEKPEIEGFKEKFTRVVKNYRRIMRRSKLLNFYSNGYGQLALIVPLILATPRYFIGEMQLGGLMQTITAFGNVQDALSYFVTSYDSVAQLVAVTHRLNGFTQHMEAVESLERKVVTADSGAPSMEVEKLRIALPDGRILLSDCSLSLAPGSRVLVTGRSGCGKSTFLRTLAGLWPFGSGRLLMPKGDKVLFLPQRPYLPLGSLRRAICYPSQEWSGQDIEAVLQLTGLDALISQLDTVDDWSRILSLGEQQRIAFARVLLVKPQWLFLDEATSALDEQREREMYELLHEELSKMSIMSVGHRSTLFVQHEQELHFDGSGHWSFESLAI